MRTARPKHSMIARKTLALVGVAAVALSALPSAARAQTTTFTSFAAFLANVQPGFYTETFTGGATPGVLSASFSGGTAPFAYTVTAGSGTPVYREGTFIGNATGFQSLTITFTSGNPTAIGANFFITNVGDAFVSAPITLNLSNGFTTTFTPTSPADYRGFTTTSPITSLVLTAPGLNAAPFQFNTLDNLTVGLASSTVPEPSTYALMGAGLAALAFVARRRRA